MCWACDPPDATLAAHLDHLRDLIRVHGWAVQVVAADGADPPWAYTVGRTALGAAELVVAGLPATVAHDVLTAAVANPPPVRGRPVRLAGGPPIGPVRLIPVTDPAAHLAMAVELYGPGVTAHQLVHTDLLGRWPWQRGYRGMPGSQPLLGRGS